MLDDLFTTAVYLVRAIDNWKTPEERKEYLERKSKEYREMDYYDRINEDFRRLHSIFNGGYRP